MKVSSSDICFIQKIANKKFKKIKKKWQSRKARHREEEGERRRMRGGRSRMLDTSAALFTLQRFVL